MNKDKDFIKKHPWYYYIILIIDDLLIWGAIIISCTLKMSINDRFIISGLIIFFSGFQYTVFFIILGIKDLWRENPYIVVAGIIAWLIIGTIIDTTYNTPGEITKYIIVYLATIGTLLFAFVPQGLININEKYWSKRIYQPYDKEKLFKKISDISYFLAIFIGTAIADILISPIFHNLFVKTTKGAKNSLHYDYFLSKNPILEISALVYSMILIFAVAALILGFLEIFTILH
ncbi:MAG: hypothetical protein ACYCSB_04735 [bacterium]